MKLDFHPIEDAPRDGRTLFVADAEEGGWIAAAHWTNGFWALGHKGRGVAVQIDFDPTRFAYPSKGSQPAAGPRGEVP